MKKSIGREEQGPIHSDIKENPSWSRTWREFSGE